MLHFFCTGRDVEDRQIELQFSKEEHVWKMLDDSLENKELLLPKEMKQLLDFMKVHKYYSGNNTEFCELYNEHTGQAVSVSSLKRLMKRWRDKLEEFGLSFRDSRSNGVRLLNVTYSDASDASDG